MTNRGPNPKARGIFLAFAVQSSVKPDNEIFRRFDMQHVQRAARSMLVNPRANE